ncbi:aminopeptidase [Punctularia strigosozonata HHB-11173 SS5]|uniref:Peptide hydrolase n=1 Tax=Punctularia strigosozonata (strain HHB-11173) TaxID=741275 RepID=R7S3E6_PUNST|nr:aminopeptidase [Punctularia strigosozonata HHB-11173 SS5]EIN04935.1 aminopeptidase [Punctularia strigosozonata HHB-11173 SS5]
MPAQRRSFTRLLAFCLASAAFAHAFVVLQQQAPILLEDASRGADTLASKELVDSTVLQSTITKDNLLKRAQDLYEIAKVSVDEWQHPTRVIGSEGHAHTLEYIAQSLESLGDYYNISTQSFPAVVGQVFESRLVLANGVPDSARAMSNTPPTPKKEPVLGKLALVHDTGCAPHDYPSDVAGAIAFIPRGTCSFGDKSALAGLAGAKAAVVYNTEPGNIAGTLGRPSPNHVPTFGISAEDAASFIEQLARGEKIDASAYIDSYVSEIKTQNVLAQTTAGDPDNCVMLGGHSDSVGAGPGINDDGSGSLTLLEVATQLTNYTVNNCVRFAWWSAEEEGLLGSDYYVSVLEEEEKAKIRLFMDYDMLASPNHAYQVYNATNDVNPLGSEELRDLYVDWYTANGHNFTFIPFDGRSDYDAFIKNGIPGGGIATGAEVIKTEEEEEMFGGQAGIAFDPCYHELCDDVSNLNLDAWVVNAKLVAHSVATYARSLNGFPKVNRQALASASPYEPRYHGSKLAM